MTSIQQSAIRNRPSERIKVLHLITDLDPGGAEIMLFKLLSAINPLAFESLVVSMTGRGLVGRKIEESGVRILSLNMPKGRVSLTGFIKLIKLLQREKPDILLTWMYHANLLGILAGQFSYRFKVVWNIRCSNVEFERYKKLTYWVMKVSAWLSSLPAAIIVNSRKGSEFHTALGYHPKQWEIIYNGFDLERFNIDPSAGKEVRKELEIGNEKLVVGLISRFDPMKDHETFLRAARLLCKKYPDICFLLVGEGVSGENKFFTPYLFDNQLKGRLILLGFREDIPRILNALDISTSSSSGEGFPNIIGESMACGIPCVVTDVGDSAFLIGETGILVPPRDPAALMEGWAELIARKETGRKALGLAARDRISRLFSIEKVTLQYETLFRRVLS
ncbi:MAG: glycosyltransferase [Deltaproteobacteria bacterium]|nr:glycosyltransferase [Deltaproteobacteria bacterium]